MKRPAELNAQPWRFKPGDHCYVRGWRQNMTGRVLIIDQLVGCILPHYAALDSTGATWRFSQLELSRRPITL